MEQAFSGRPEGPTTSQALHELLAPFLCLLCSRLPVPWTPNSLLCPLLFEEEDRQKEDRCPYEPVDLSSPRASSAKNKQQTTKKNLLLELRRIVGSPGGAGAG